MYDNFYKLIVLQFSYLEYNKFMKFLGKIKYFSILSLVIIVIFLTPYILNGFSYQGFFDIISRTSAAIIVGFCIYAVYCLFKKRKINNVLLGVANILCLIVLIVSFIYILGYVQDIMGYRCTGFFSTSTSCFEKAQFRTSILFLHPLSLAILGILSLGAIYNQAKIKDK